MDDPKHRLGGALSLAAGFIAAGGRAQRPAFFARGCAFVSPGGAFTAIARRPGKG